MEKITRFEIGLFALLVVYFLFAATNINSQLGDIYAIFALSTLIFILLDPKRDIKFRKESDSLLGSLVGGAGAYVVLITVGTFLLIPLVRKAIELLGATTPVLATNAFFQFITFAIAIPIVETYFFFMVIFDLASSIFKVDISRKNLLNFRLWLIIIGIALIFMFFHLTAKGIGATDVLALVFFMAVLSMILVTWYRTGEAAVYFHVLANMIPSLSLLGFSVLNVFAVGNPAWNKDKKLSEAHKQNLRQARQKGLLDGSIKIWNKGLTKEDERVKKCNMEQNLISLCRSCHTLTNYNREYWTKLFQEKLNKIYRYSYSQDNKIVINLN